MSSDQLKAIDRSRRFKLAEHWLRAFWPVLLMVGAGGTVFRAAVVQSILSTPHPGLVYTIFAVLGATVALSADALWRFDREEKLAMHLRVLTEAERLDYLQSRKWKSEMRPVYDTALKPDFNQGLHVLQQKIEAEMYSCEEQLLSRLDLPTYLGGALVGIGLVGTFVGLLTSLTDLGTLLSALMSTGSSTSDPVAMFSDMLRRLQKPMQGMGTAFVASMYGLMGSLIMGLVLYSVRKSGNKAVGRVRELLRSLAVQFSAEAGLSATMGALSTPAAMERILMTMQQERAALSQGLDSFSDAIHRQSSLLDLLNQRVDLNNRQNRELEDLLSELRDFGRHWVDQNPKSTMSSRTWRRTGAVVVVCVVVSTLAATVMHVRSSERLSRQIGAFLRVAEQRIQPQVVPTTKKDDTRPVVPAAEASADSVYVFVKGDKLEHIARLHGLDLKELLKANPELHNPNVVPVGQKIQFPTTKKDYRLPAVPAAEVSADSVYVVIRGDKLEHIARLHGLDLKELLKANPRLRDPNLVPVGQKIRFP